MTDMSLYSLCISETVNELVQILMQCFRLLLPSCNEKLLSFAYWSIMVDESPVSRPTEISLFPGMGVWMLAGQM